jgi:hypothetical protein
MLRHTDPYKLEHLALAADTLPILVCVLHLEGTGDQRQWRLESLNTFACNVFGVNREQWLGTYVDESFPILGQPSLLSTVLTLVNIGGEADLGPCIATNGHQLNLLAGVKCVEELADQSLELPAYALNSPAAIHVASAWKAAFLHANEELDVQAMEQLLSQLLPSQDALVDSLRKLVHDYAFEHVAHVLGTLETSE